MTGKELKEWSVDVGKAIDSYIFDLDNLSHHVEVTRRDFIQGHKAMLDRARETARALREIAREDWINPKYIAFLADQGPEFLTRFAGLNDEQQHRMQEAWGRTTELTNESGDSIDRMTRVLDNLDKGTTNHKVIIDYVYQGFDPSKPGMSVSRPVP